MTRVARRSFPSVNQFVTCTGGRQVKEGGVSEVHTSSTMASSRCIGMDSRVACEIIGDSDGRGYEGLAVSGQSPRSGSSMFACFRPNSVYMMAPSPPPINGLKKGSPGATAQTTAKLSWFMDGARNDQLSGDEPTSPVVTCIGQVRMRPPKKVKAVDTVRKQMDIKWQGSQAKLQKGAAAPPGSPCSGQSKPFKWKQLVGAKGTMNPSSQPASEQEFEIDLSRFRSGCTGSGAPSLTNSKLQSKSGRHFAKSMMLSEEECKGRGPPELTLAEVQSAQALCSGRFRQSEITAPNMAPAKPLTEEPLWKRRCGVKPLTLEVKGQCSSAPASVK